MMSQAAGADVTSLDRLLDALGRARQEIAKCVVGHTAVIDELLIALICEGHVLLQGAPGVGKTLLAAQNDLCAERHAATTAFLPRQPFQFIKLSTV